MGGRECGEATALLDAHMESMAEAAMKRTVATFSAAGPTQTSAETRALVRAIIRADAPPEEGVEPRTVAAASSGSVGNERRPTNDGRYSHDNGGDGDGDPRRRGEQGRRGDRDRSRSSSTAATVAAAAETLANFCVGEPPWYGPLRDAVAPEGNLCRLMKVCLGPPASIGRVPSSTTERAAENDGGDQKTGAERRNATKKGDVGAESKDAKRETPTEKKRERKSKIAADSKTDALGSPTQTVATITTADAATKTPGTRNDYGVDEIGRPQFYVGGRVPGSSVAADERHRDQRERERRQKKAAQREERRRHDPALFDVAASAQAAAAVWRSASAQAAAAVWRSASASVSDTAAAATGSATSSAAVALRRRNEHAEREARDQRMRVGARLQQVLWSGRKLSGIMHAVYRVFETTSTVAKAGALRYLSDVDQAWQRHARELREEMRVISNEEVQLDYELLESQDLESRRWKLMAHTHTMRVHRWWVTAVRYMQAILVLLSYDRAHTTPTATTRDSAPFFSVLSPRVSSSSSSSSSSSTPSSSTRSATATTTPSGPRPAHERALTETMHKAVALLQSLTGSVQMLQSPSTNFRTPRRSSPLLDARRDEKTASARDDDDDDLDRDEDDDDERKRERYDGEYDDDDDGDDGGEGDEKDRRDGTRGRDDGFDSGDERDRRGHGRYDERRRDESGGNGGPRSDAQNGGRRRRGAWSEDDDGDADADVRDRASDGDADRASRRGGGGGGDESDRERAYSDEERDRDGRRAASDADERDRRVGAGDRQRRDSLESFGDGGGGGSRGGRSDERGDAKKTASDVATATATAAGGRRTLPPPPPPLEHKFPHSASLPERPFPESAQAHALVHEWLTLIEKHGLLEPIRDLRRTVRKHDRALRRELAELSAHETRRREELAWRENQNTEALLDPRVMEDWARNRSDGAAAAVVATTTAPKTPGGGRGAAAKPPVAVAAAAAAAAAADPESIPAERAACYQEMRDSISRTKRKLDRASARRRKVEQRLLDLKRYVDASRASLNVGAHRKSLRDERRLLKTRDEIVTHTAEGRRGLRRRIADKRTAAVTERLQAFLAVARALCATRREADRASWRSLRKLWYSYRPAVQKHEEHIAVQLPSPHEHAVESVTHQIHMLRTTVANAAGLFDDFRQFFQRRLCWLFCQQYLTLIDIWRVPD